jgi:hypothetical protein
MENLDEIIEQTEEISQKLKEFKELAKTLKKETKKREPKEKKDGVVKERKIKESAILYQAGIRLYQYKESAVKDGYQNPKEIQLKDVIIDLYQPKPKPEKKSRKSKIQQPPEEGGTVINKVEKQDKNISFGGVEINYIK